MHRIILLVIAVVACVPVSGLAQTIPLAVSSSSLQLNLEADRATARIMRLGWDTEGTNRAGINLLKAVW